MEKHKFAELSEEQLKVIETLEIGEHVISKEHLDILVDTLELKGKDEEALRAIRNTCVKHLSGKIEEVRNNEDIKEGMRFLTNMSGVTAAIDNYLWYQGYEV